MPLHDMEHAVDPAQAILKRVEGRLPSCPGYKILVATYHRPEKTAGGIIVPEKSRDEDIYQGKMYLVLETGEDAYKSDDYRKFETPWCKKGDWILASRTDMRSFGISVPADVVDELKDGVREQHLAYISDDKVLGVVPGPNGYL